MKFDPVFIVFIILIFIIVGALFGYGIYILLRDRKKKNDNEALPDATPKCADSVTNLTNVSELKFCKNEEGIKYFKQLGVKISTTPVSYQEVCKAFCTGTYDKSNNTCSTGATTQLTDCINRLKPNGCHGLANPIGQDGSTLYYAKEKSDPCEY